MSPSLQNSDQNPDLPGGSSSDVAEIDVQAAFEFLTRRTDAQLVDVRTHAEWSFVGAPVLPFRDAGPIFVEWQSYPAMQVNPRFLEELEAELSRRGVAAQAPLLFLCRSGVRSRAAGLAMSRAGGRPIFNVTDGFEGPLDEAGRRGKKAGWRAAGLPWRQS